jgi:hypothetical protein
MSSKGSEDVGGSFSNGKEGENVEYGPAEIIK